MSNLAIRVHQVSKTYRLGKRAAGYKTLRDSIMHLASIPSLGLRGQSRILETARDFWALRDVSLELEHGQALGVIGANGAGKSTLLKILARITEPSSGWVHLRGRVGTLLEVGTGFHPELTGRENIFLSGAILGMRRTEISRKFDEIVAFAGLNQFLDTAVKHYSSGMYVRLAFGVAAHLEPEILLVDEVLAVGDAAFQKKCLGKMDAVTKEGRTILFVSHNMGAIRQLCSHVIWIDRGRIVAAGSPNQIISAYLESASEGFVQRNLESECLRIDAVTLLNQHGQATTRFAPGDTLQIRIDYFAKQGIQLPYFWLGVTSQYGSLFSANMLLDGVRPAWIEGSGTLRCVFKNLPLLPQTYTIQMGVRNQDGTQLLLKSGEVAFFNIEGTAQEIGLRGEVADSVISSNSAPILIPYEWQLPDGQLVSIEGFATLKDRHIYSPVWAES